MGAIKRLPTGRIGRLAKIARTGARTGASLLLSKDGAGAARHAAEVLGNLRGLAAKVGQMASYVDGFIPEGQRDAYETAMRGLRAAAPQSSPDAIRKVVERELAAPIDELYAEWEDEPFASASIGQVHRAKLTDGRDVAVKVQHPGIERAVESDLSNASVLEGMIGALGPRALNSKQIFAEISKRFREELDYELEGRHQQWFAKLHEGDPHIRVPAVVTDRTSRRVLTTALVAGRTLDEAAELDAELRRHYGRTLWRFVFKGNLVGGRFNADPHPGNYLFDEDGRVHFLDFGCVQPIASDHQANSRAMHLAALRKDDAGFRDATVTMLGLRGGEYERDALEFVRRCFRPLFESPFQITRDYVAGLVQSTQDMKKHMFSKTSSFVPFPPGMVFLNRLQFGFYSVLARLDVAVDYASIERDFFRSAGVLPE